MEGIAWDLTLICFDALMRSPKNSLPTQVFSADLIFLLHTEALSETVLQDVVAVSTASQVMNGLHANHNAGKGVICVQSEAVFELVRHINVP